MQTDFYLVLILFYIPLINSNVAIIYTTANTHKMLATILAIRKIPFDGNLKMITIKTTSNIAANHKGIIILFY